MRIVLDSNVLVSGMLRPFGASAALLRLIVTGSVGIVSDGRILLEYEDVLARPKLGIAAEDAKYIIDQLRVLAEVTAPNPLRVVVPDPDDLPFMEVAVSAAADFIVTGNKKHFPARACKGIPVVSPREFLDRLSL